MSIDPQLTALQVYSSYVLIKLKMIDWKWWILAGIGLGGLIYAIKTYNLKKNKENLESDKKVWIAILQPNCTHKEGITHSPFNYQIGEETFITEKEKQFLEECYKNNGYDWFEFKKR
ncbi:hypothetical protein HY500_03255 [Candidatus Woesearchaeota archaeon]|nr:hypothetical protein [Candidatus Woesearchaeota archaeon]